MKGDKEHLPMSLRVKDAAEALLVCITDQVVSIYSSSAFGETTGAMNQKQP